MRPVRLPVLAFLLIFSLLTASTRSAYGAQIEKVADGTALPEGSARSGGIYRAPLLNNPRSLDPAYVQDIYGITVVRQLFEGLVRFSPDLFVVPALAESWQVEAGGKAYRFFLRKDARFHNGKPITSDDVVFSLSRLLRIDPPPNILHYLLKITGAIDYRENKTERIIGLRAIDDHTVVVRLDQPYVPFLVSLGMHQAAIVPREELIGKGTRFAQEPVGSGPFMFKSWEENKNIRLGNFPGYYAGKSFLDEIDYIIYPGIAIEEVWADFRNGKLDEMPVYAPIRQNLQGMRDVQLIHRPSLSLQFYGINCEHPFLKDENLRAALNKALDRKKLVARAYDGQYEPARTILPPGMPGYHPREEKPTNNIDTALDYMKRAAAAEPNMPRSIEIVSNSQSPFAQAELNFVRESWARLGINMEPKFISDWSHFEQYIKSESMQVFRYVWFADIPDPDDFLRVLFSAHSQLNYMHYNNEDVERKLQIAAGTIDPLERANMYKTIEETILKSSPVIPLIHLNVDYVYQPYVQGIEMSALGAHNVSFHRVWLKELPRR